MEKSKLCEYIGKVVHAKRKEINMRQEHMAEFLGLSRASIVNLEKGRHMVQVTSLHDLAGLFKCSIAEFFPPSEAVDFTLEDETVMVERTKKVFKIITPSKQ